MRIHSGDTVKIISGKDRGKIGKVGKVFLEKKKVTVSKVNVVKKHVRPTDRNPEGGVIEKTLPVAVANVKLICPDCNEVTRVGYRFEDGRKWRVCKKCGVIIR